MSGVAGQAGLGSLRKASAATEPGAVGTRFAAPAARYARHLQSRMVMV